MLKLLIGMYIDICIHANLGEKQVSLSHMLPDIVIYFLIYFVKHHY